MADTSYEREKKAEQRRKTADTIFHGVSTATSVGSLFINALKIAGAFNDPGFYEHYKALVTPKLNFGARKSASIGTFPRLPYMMVIRTAEVLASDSSARSTDEFMLFSAISGMNTNNVPYSANDVANYVQAVRGMLVLYARACYVLMAANSIVPTLGTSADALLRPLGMSLNDVISHKLALFNAIQTLRSAILQMPFKSALMERIFRQYTSLLLDNNTNGPQFYLYVCNTCDYYVQSGDTYIVVNDMEAIDDADCATLIQTISACIQHVLGTAVYQRIAADYTNTFGSWLLELPTVDQGLLVKYSERGLQQIRNIEFLDKTFHYSTCSAAGSITSSGKVINCSGSIGTLPAYASMLSGNQTIQIVGSVSTGGAATDHAMLVDNDLAHNVFGNTGFYVNNVMRVSAFDAGVQTVARTVRLPTQAPVMTCTAEAKDGENIEFARYLHVISPLSNVMWDATKITVTLILQSWGDVLIRNAAYYVTDGASYNEIEISTNVINELSDPAIPALVECFDYHPYIAYASGVVSGTTLVNYSQATTVSWDTDLMSNPTPDIVAQLHFIATASLYMPLDVVSQNKVENRNKILDQQRKK